MRIVGWKTFERFYKTNAPRKVLFGVEVRNWSKYNDNVVFDKVSGALALIERHSLKHISRVQSGFRCIVVVPWLPSSSSAFFLDANVCFLRQSLVLYGIDEALTQVIVQKANHAYVRRLGVGYFCGTEKRVKDILRRDQMGFYAKLEYLDELHRVNPVKDIHIIKGVVIGLMSGLTRKPLDIIHESDDLKKDLNLDEVDMSMVVYPYLRRQLGVTVPKERRTARTVGDLISLYRNPEA